MAARETIKFLKRQIESQMVLSESGHYFLPESNFNLIFTLENIEKAVHELDCAVLDRIGLAKKIYKEGTRTFAIMIKNGEQDAIVSFRNREILDFRLPFSEELAVELIDSFGNALAREHQWQFLPYKFRRDMRDSFIKISDSGRILSFVGESEFVASGGFGDISQVKIPHSQQEFSHTEVRSGESSFPFTKTKLRDSKTSMNPTNGPPERLCSSYTEKNQVATKPD